MERGRNTPARVDTLYLVVATCYTSTQSHQHTLAYRTMQSAHLTIDATLYVTMVTVTDTFESGCDCHRRFFKVEFAIFQAILSFTLLQFYAQRCSCKLTSRKAVPTVNSASVIYEYSLFTYLLQKSCCFLNA